jgi:predicted CoA-substrate-specific enzyme activase
VITAGCDIGSLTAKAVIIKDGQILASKIIRSKARAVDSAATVMQDALNQADLLQSDIDACCSTGYGRLEIPFAQTNKSEISCHALGAFWADKSIRTIIDIGGQDCKVISADSSGKVKDFIMNDKCAAGTGRSLEILARTIGVTIEDLGPLSLKSRKPVEITNKCSIFMELEVFQHLCKKEKIKDIASGINRAIAKRVAALAKTGDIQLNSDICITGGVSKNIGVVASLEKILGLKFKQLTIDPQLAGAIGAALFASQEEK